MADDLVRPWDSRKPSGDPGRPPRCQEPSTQRSWRTDAAGCRAACARAVAPGEPAAPLGASAGRRCRRRAQPTPAGRSSSTISSTGVPARRSPRFRLWVGGVEDHDLLMNLAVVHGFGPEPLDGPSGPFERPDELLVQVRISRDQCQRGHAFPAYQRRLRWWLFRGGCVTLPHTGHVAKPIGIFDSGLGGLTVARAIHAAFPAEDLVYLGDTARVPYGTRSAGTVVRYAIGCAPSVC